MTATVKDFLVPDLGEGLEDATITSWSVAVGDIVELNQTLCTVETNKAEVEIPSPYAGRIIELGGGEGETLMSAAVLVRIATVRNPISRPAPSARRSSSDTAPTTRWTTAGERVHRRRSSARETAGAQAGGGAERRPQRGWRARAPTE